MTNASRYMCLIYVNIDNIVVDSNICIVIQMAWIYYGCAQFADDKEHST